ncbi:PKD domain-containing protein [Vibrio tapetis]|uniref:Putative PKD domain-containing protein n=1 Tax=Vibrio tapetis subsp. tapetis TaxID=1671868 RepID=A0A2N8ZLK8_9VIBR|nr:PKD domain-containing protein [Vibrio tapetis]SON52801.1 putative PKD domain-containing protein [Vibrio tapetis subsp. tapetis]
MKTSLKWILISFAIPALAACNGGGSDANKDVDATKNQVPIAVAGQDQNVAFGSLVKLDGKNSTDKDKQLLTYKWSLKAKPAGSAATLSATDVVAPQFTPDKAGTYVVSLMVNDGKVDSKAVDVTIVVAPKAINSLPVVNAGADKTHAIGSPVSITATATDADNDALTYAWSIQTQAANSTPTLTNGDTKTVTLNANTQGDYTLQLSVSDGKDTVKDSVTVTLEPANVAPVAKAGADQTVAKTAVVNLDGSGSSDANNDAILYEWAFVSKPANSVANLTGANTATPSFTADLVGEYVVSLTASDGHLKSTASNVKVTVTEAVKNELKIVFHDRDPALNVLPYVFEPITINKTFADPKPATYKIASFSLEAVGQDYTLKEVTAWGLMGVVQPIIKGVVEGQVIKAGETVEIELLSPLTGGQQAMLSFSVIIAEDISNYMVAATYLFTTN